MRVTTRDDKSVRIERDAWVVLALAILTGGLTGPGQTIGVSVFIDHFVDDLDLSRSAVSTAYLIGTLTGALFLPRVGRFIDARGVRLAQMIIGVLFALALVNMSFVNGIVWLTIGFTGIRLMGQGSLSLVTSVTVALRFAERRSTAIGIQSTATAGLMALVPIGLTGVIAIVGWRSAWLVAAAVVVGTVVPIAFFGLRKMPTRTADAQTHVTSNSAVVSYTREEAVRTRAFWIIVAVSGSAGMLSTALNFHQIDLLGEAGLSRSQAAILFAPQVIGSSIAGLSFGWLGDRFGSRYLLTISMALLAVSHVLAATAAPGLRVVVYAISLGMASGAVHTATSAALPNWFGTGHIGSISGLKNLFNVAASSIGPVALALTQGWFGSYPPAILLLMTIPIAAGLFSLTPLGLRPVSAIASEDSTNRG